jgi:hypothetical protein
VRFPLFLSSPFCSSCADVLLLFPSLPFSSQPSQRPQLGHFDQVPRVRLRFLPLFSLSGSLTFLLVGLNGLRSSSRASYVSTTSVYTNARVRLKSAVTRKISVRFPLCAFEASTDAFPPPHSYEGLHRQPHGPLQFVISSSVFTVSLTNPLLPPHSQQQPDRLQPIQLHHSSEQSFRHGLFLVPLLPSLSSLSTVQTLVLISLDFALPPLRSSFPVHRPPPSSCSPLYHLALIFVLPLVFFFFRSFS